MAAAANPEITSSNSWLPRYVRFLLATFLCDVSGRAADVKTTEVGRPIERYRTAAVARIPDNFVNRG